MIRAKLTGKNQITIPKEVRRELNLERGDCVAFEKSRRGGGILFRKVAAPRKSDGAAVPYLRKNVVLSVGEMKKAAVAGAAKTYRRRGKAMDRSA